MAWNEPGNSNKQQDPQGNRGKPDMPPDLDEVLRQLRKKIGDLFSKNKLGSSPSSNQSPEKNNRPAVLSHLGKFSPNVLIAFFLFVLIIIWILSGIFIVGPSEKAAILRFGQYSGTEDPGLHWIPTFIDDKYIVNVQQVLNYPYQAEMLTQDENIVSVELTVQYRIDNLKNYLFNVANPTETLQQATASALRQVIGQTSLDNVLTSGREQVRQQTMQILQNTLANYHAGILVMDVNMQPAKPPEEVTAAFDDAIKAREDEQRFKNQAVTYANRIIPAAQGTASRLNAEAIAYQQQVVLGAQGATAEFLALLPAYQRDPAVMRERMYLDTLQSVFTNTPTVVVDTPAGNNMMYLPLDKLMHNAAGSSDSTQAQINPANSNIVKTTPTDISLLPLGSDTNFTGRPGYTIPPPQTQNNLQGQGG